MNTIPDLEHMPPALVVGDGDFISFSNDEGLWIFPVDKVKMVGIQCGEMWFFLTCGHTVWVKADTSILNRAAEAWESGRLRRICEREGVEIRRWSSNAILLK
jgi:hypothetical protein